MSKPADDRAAERKRAKAKRDAERVREKATAELAAGCPHCQLAWATHYKRGEYRPCA